MKIKIALRVASFAICASALNVLFIPVRMLHAFYNIIKYTGIDLITSAKDAVSHYKREIKR
jgi:hypothetical protein